LSDLSSGTITVPDAGGAVCCFIRDRIRSCRRSQPREGRQCERQGFLHPRHAGNGHRHPKKGYSFVNWTEDGEEVSTNPEYTFNITASCSLVANFARESTPVTYTVTVSANPRQGGSVSGGGTYREGDWVTVTATPKKGYIFFNWTENGEEVSAEATYRFEMGTESRTLVANFLR
jgi:hypothetical protein